MVMESFCRAIVDFQAVSVEYLELCDKYFIVWLRKQAPRQGAKPACGSALLLAKLTEVLLRYF